MKVGLMTTPRESTADTVAIAQMAEDRGIESIWLGEHSHLPTATEHAFHEETPDFYKRVPDPYITVAAAASVTKRIRLGTAISLPAEHNPLSLAKTPATLDHASAGCFEWGVGYGWNQLEMVNRGLDPRYRMATFRHRADTPGHDLDYFVAGPNRRRRISGLGAGGAGLGELLFLCRGGFIRGGPGLAARRAQQ
jgi:alkanesulfonate monooxygenase SsuD/methylene tetrahydromethanopterin reductase-like flavin-dependent oxidoreductase (luciferase family)